MSNEFPYPRYQLKRRFLRGLAAASLSLLCNFKVYGEENIPEGGPLLVVGNHFNFADPVLMLRIMPFPMEFLAGFHRPNAPAIVRWLPEVWGIYPVRRGGASRTAMRAASAVMAQNGVLGMFPEGGAWTDHLRPARPGVSYIASTTNAQILPIGIAGMPDLFPMLRKGKRATVTVRIGKPFGPFTVEGRGRARRSQLDEIGHEVMRQIGALLPPERRGVYADDPAIRAEAEKVANFPCEDLIG